MDVAFYLYFDFHRAMLEPVYELLRLKFDCMLTAHNELILKARPKILVVADRQYELFRPHLPESIIVWLRHGFGSKNNFAPCVTGCDFACLNSEWTQQSCLRSGVKPRMDFWVTGFVPADVLFQPPGQLPPELRDTDFSSKRKTILYAPTYNQHLNSVDALKDAWIASLRQEVGDLNVIIKPHPVIPERNPDWMCMWRQWQAQYEYVYLIEDAHASIYPLFKLADLLVSDASSTAFYFLALDRPIVLVSNPERSLEPHYFDPHGPEWQWRDIGVEANTASEAVEAIARCLDNPQLNRDRRAFYAERVFGTTRDGRAAERVAGKISSLLSPDKADEGWVSDAWQAARQRAQACRS